MKFAQLLTRTILLVMITIYLEKHIGLKKGKVAVLSQKGNPTKSMMQTLDSQKDGTIMRFQEIMEKMDRHDVLRIIENWIKHEWNDPQRRIKWLF